MLRLISLKIFEGPSVYSHKRVAKIQLEMGKYIDTSSTELVGFYDRLVSDFPGLRIHQCSKKYVGGFLERLREGTYLPHIIEHLCLETQAILGYDVHYGKTRWAQRDVYNIIFAYKNKQLVKPIVDFVLGYIKSILSGKDFNFNKGLRNLSQHTSFTYLDYIQKKSPFIIAAAKRGIKSSVVDLAGNVLVEKGIKTGIASTKGISVNNEKTSEKNLVSKSMAHIVLDKEDIDAAVLELDSQIILAEGLPYSVADVAIITGLLDEHLGERYIETIEQLIDIKTLIVEAVKSDGVTILNADDPYFLEFAKRAKDRIVLFGLNKSSPVMKQHISDGGEAVFCFEDGIYFTKATLGTKVLEFKDMLAFYVGTDYIYDIMAAICTIYAYGIPLEGARDIFLPQLRKEQYKLNLTPQSTQAKELYIH